MFQDPFTSVMAMLLLCFMGILVMFLFCIRLISLRATETHEFFRKQQVSLADIERQLMDMHFALRTLQGGDNETVSTEAASSGQGGGSASRSQEGAASLRESAGQRTGPSLRFDDQLLPPPPKARAATEDFDPISDPRLFEDSLLPEPAYGAYRPRSDKARAGALTKRGSSLSINLDE